METQFSDQIKEFAKQQENSDFFSNNDKLLPQKHLIFKALELVKKPSQVRVVIFGQDPYPNATSACGVAFLDAAVTSFESKQLAVSLKNIIKSLLTFNKYNYQNMDTVRLIINNTLTKQFKTVQKWFEQLSTECGVLWLNTSLTFEDSKNTTKHAKFWQPVVEKIIKQIIQESQGVVFVMMGGYAQQLEKVILENKKGNYKCVKTAHPVVQQFQIDALFNQLKEAELQVNGNYVDFLDCRIKIEK